MSEPPHDDLPPEGEPARQRPENRPAEDPPAGGALAAGSAFSSTDTARLLVRALSQLPPADRDRVYTWLLGTSLTPQPGVTGPLGHLGWAVKAEAPPARQQDFAEAGAELVRTLFRGAPAPAQQMVPVRFSVEQHARLRAWCTEHGFSMATVIRGLVDRFLDSQPPAGT